MQHPFDWLHSEEPESSTYTQICTHSVVNMHNTLLSNHWGKHERTQTSCKEV